MLLRLEIRDFAVISNMVFEPGYGLNVISGETGAGKSLIVGAIGLILGAKSTRNVIVQVIRAALSKPALTARISTMRILPNALMRIPLHLMTEC